MLNLVVFEPCSSLFCILNFWAIKIYTQAILVQISIKNTAFPKINYQKELQGLNTGS